MLSEAGYINKKGMYDHSEHDGRTWVEHDLFSRLKPIQYIEMLTKAGFKHRFMSAMIDPNSLLCLGENECVNKRLISENDKLDLIVSGMSIIYIKM
jgi:hypothetical protein